MKPFFLLACLLLTSVWSYAQVVDKDSILATYDSGKPEYAEADQVLNEIRFTTSNEQKINERIKKLEQLLTKFPKYPFRGEAYYFLGINNQFLGHNGEAVAAFRQALVESPEIAQKTPISAYLKTAEKKHIADFYPRLITILILLCLFAVIVPLSRQKFASLPIKKTALVFGSVMVVWVLVVLTISWLFGCPAGGLEHYPQPVLVNRLLGKMGDEPLVSLLLYGIAAIVAAAVVTLTATPIKKAALRISVSVVGSLVLSSLILLLYYFSVCYGKVSYNSGHLVFLVKDIAWKKEVPDDMLPLYDKDFRKKIIEAKRKAGTQ